MSTQWYLLHSKPRQEDIAAEHLKRQGYQVCLPRLRVPKLRRLRWQQAVEPLFPRYLFAALEEGAQSFQPLHSTRGVSRVVRFGEAYARVPPTLIDQLVSATDDSGVHEFRASPFQVGERVRVFAGPLRDLEGVFERTEGRERVHVLLEVMGRETRVTLAAAHVVPVVRGFAARDPS